MKFDFERQEAVNVSGPILRRCALCTRPPAYQNNHLFLSFPGWAPHQLSFFVGKMYFVRRDCMIAFFFIYQLPLWILLCLVDPNVPFMGWCSTDTHSRKPGQKAWQSVWWRAIMVPYAINEDVCELNNRTKKARPDDLVPDENSIYVTRLSEGGIGRGSRVVM